MTTATPAEVAGLGAEETALAVPEYGPLQPALAPMSSDDVLRQVRLIQEVMGKAMKEGEHYGVIPGTDKPSLLKSGAEKLSLTFRLRPRFGLERLDLAGEHREYVVTCDLYNTTGGHEGQGIGSCSTMESKYRWRQAKRQCPSCGAEAIIRGKAEYGGGWLCWKKQNGCGAKFAATAPEIVAQVADRIENPDLADTFNTVLKMAKKRALVDATLTATAASDLFTQDLEDLPRVPKSAPRSRPITAEQVRRLHTCIDRLALPAEHVHERLAAYDAARLEDLTAANAALILTKLDAALVERDKKTTAKEP